MDGMPIQYLDGVDAPSTLEDLVARRNDIAANPAKYARMQDVSSMLKMYDYAIQYWNTPNRDKALDILEAEEERLTREGAILDGVAGLDGKFFKKVKKVAKKARVVVAPSAAAAVFVAKRVAKPIAKKVVRPAMVKMAKTAARVTPRPTPKPVAKAVRPAAPVAVVALPQNTPPPYVAPAYQPPTVEEPEVLEEEVTETAQPVEPMSPVETYPEEEIPAPESAEPVESTIPEDEEAVGYIYGISEDVLNLVHGLDGGLNGTDDDAQKVYTHLLQTREIIRKRPELVASVQHPAAMLRMFDYAIAHFNTPNRDTVLGILAAEEERLAASGAILHGIDDLDLYGLEGLDGKFWKSVKKAVSTTAKGAVSVAKKAGNLMLVVNPVTIAARNGLLVAMRLNMNHLSSKLAPAYLTADQAKAAGITPESHKKAQDALKKVQTLFQKRLRGKSSSLKKAILCGKRKKWRKPVTLDQNAMAKEAKGADTASLEGLGEVVVAATSVAAATPFIIKATTYIKDLFTNEEKQQFLAEAAKAGKSKKDAKKEWKEQQKSKPKKKGDTFNKAAKFITDAVAERSSTPEEKQQEVRNPKSEERMENPNPSFLEKHGKKLVVGGLVLATAAVIYSVTKQKKAAPASNSPQAALNGISRRKKATRKRKTSTARRASTAKRATKRAKAAPKKRTTKKRLKPLKLR